MAASTSARLPAVTPVMPRVFSCSSVGAVPPAAPLSTAATAVAMFCSSAVLSVLTAGKVPTKLFTADNRLTVLTPVTPALM